MAAQFYQKTFLRHIPMPELRRFFATRKCLSALAWDKLKDNEVDPIFDAWLDLGDEDRLYFEHVARQVHDLATPAGIKAIIEEGHFHKLDLTDTLEKIDGLYAKVLWTYLEHPQVFKVAAFFNHADMLSARYWRKRKNIPKTAPRVEPAALTEFGAELSQYYRVIGRVESGHRWARQNRQ